jgi:hypothetical protein
LGHGIGGSLPVTVRRPTGDHTVTVIIARGADAVPATP